MPVDTLFPTVTEMAPVTPIASRQVVGVPAMARMIREARGLLVKDLADMVGRSSSYISKVEAGAVELVGEPLQEYARALDVSTDLLATKYQPVPLEGAHFRSHTSTPMRVRKQAVAEANWAHLFLQLLLDLGEFNHPRAVPQVDADLVGGGGAAVADIVRRTWRITGRVENMTSLLESAGVFVLTFPHDHRHVDAVTVRGENITAVIMIRDDLPPERRRWTLAHELGHLVMDDSSTLEPRMLEARADAFAGQFLAPFEDLADDLDNITPSQIERLDGLRRYWGISLGRPRSHRLQRWLHHRAPVPLLVPRPERPRPPARRPRRRMGRATPSGRHARGEPP
jgi:transcriptional regulator with XRE-family HTH domain